VITIPPTLHAMHYRALHCSASRGKNDVIGRMCTWNVLLGS